MSEWIICVKMDDLYVRIDYMCVIMDDLYARMDYMCQNG